MNPEVQKLLVLQEFDGRLEILRQELTSRPQLVELQDSRVTGIESHQQELTESIKQKRMAIDRTELEIKSQDAKIQDSKSKVTSIKSNLEYSGLMQQISRFEQERGVLEEQLLVLWDDIETLEKQKKSQGDELSEARTVLTDEQQILEEEAKEIRDEAVSLLKRREEARAPVDAEILESYDLLFSRYRDRSVVSAEGGVCSGCHISLNPQTMNQLQGSKDIVCCKNCTRILFL